MSLDYPKDSKSEEEWWNKTLVPQIDEPKPVIDEDKWWEGEPDTRKTKEHLIDQIKAMQQAHRSIPRALLVKQGIAIIYIALNTVFMYVYVESRYMGYLAAYMVPLIILLVDYFLVVEMLKKIARGERR